LSFLGLAALLLSAAQSDASAAITGSFDRTLQVSGPVDLEVKSGSGSVTVTTGGPEVVRILGKIRASSGRASEQNVRYLEDNPPIEKTGNSIRVGYVDDPDRLRNISISYEIVVPVETSLTAKTGSGSQSIGDIRGPVEATSGSGSLTLGDIGGDVKATAGSGSLKVSSAKGRLHVKTGSGSIRAYGVAGPITSSSGSGSVELQQSGSGDVEIETGSGSVRIDGVRGALRVETGSGSIDAQGEMEGEWKLRSSSGRISVQLPAEAAFDLEARTSSGRIESDHPITMHELDKRELRGEVRGGGYLLHVRTSSGDIRIQ
jgi:hypothetical protein